MTEEKDTQQESLKEVTQHTKRRRVMIEATIGIVVIALAVFLWWWFVWRLEVSTDDAYVEGDLIAINSREPGVVIAFYADNTDLVEEGQLLVALDPTDYALQFQEAQTHLALQARQVKQLAEQVAENRQQVVMNSAEFALALYDFENREPLVATGAISREEFAQYKTQLEVAQAQLLMNQHALARNLAELGTAPLEEHPYIVQAEDLLREAYLRLKRCKIYAPMRGYISQRNIQVGEYVDESRNMMSVIPLDRVWVTANFKETQLYCLRIGQPVTIRVDMYGHAYMFHGKVQGINGGTGAIFSLLPPQNATGNWIKIVQRVPVRIQLDPGEVEKHPIFLGLSTYTRVDISHVEGDVLAPLPNPRRVVGTDVYRIPMEPVKEIAKQIVETNLHDEMIVTF